VTNAHEEKVDDHNQQNAEHAGQVEGEIALREIDRGLRGRRGCSGSVAGFLDSGHRRNLGGIEPPRHHSSD
jgi:hypothetical protein